MTKLVLFLIASVVTTSASAVPFVSSPARIPGTKHLFRGPQPLGHASDLKAAGISVVVIYKNDTKGEVAKERQELAAAGIKEVRHIPMAWKDLDSKLACEQTVQALQILLAAEKAGKNAYVHCTAGEDRTGMIAGLARMMVNKESTEKIFSDELCDNGYSNGNRGKPAQVVKAIEAGLTPLFLNLARKIESGALTSANLNATTACTGTASLVAEKKRCE